MADLLRVRGSGVLAHVTSLAGDHGHGDLGAGAHAFLEFLAAARQRYWQMLPVQPTGAGYSPYSGVSAFAGEARLISLSALMEQGLLTRHELPARLPQTRADYPAAQALRARALRLAHARFDPHKARVGRSYEAFLDATRYWLPDYALFMALRERAPHTPWTAWDRELAQRKPSALARAKRALREAVSYYEFEQFVFAQQWRALRTHARELGIALIGDVPIFLAHDSADVWSHREVFKLDARGAPRVVSGVPPDYFSKTGQRWGTPLYDWEALALQRYRFWIERFRSQLRLFDVLRLDHFIGFVRYWEIPARSPTALRGRFRPGPGEALFAAVRRALGSLPFIAEDLGSVTDEVRALRDRLGLPGMRVLQFAFGGDDPRTNEFLPHNYVPHCVAYTGTHDNDTARGWYEDPGGKHGPRSRRQAEKERRAALAYLAGPDAQASHDIAWLMIRALMASVANTVIFPVQDLLRLGSEARMNVPGRHEGNWTFRIPPGALNAELATELRAYTRTYGRCEDARFEALSRRSARRARKP